MQNGKILSFSGSLAARPVFPRPPGAMTMGGLAPAMVDMSGKAGSRAMGVDSFSVPGNDNVSSILKGTGGSRGGGILPELSLTRTRFDRNVETDAVLQTVDRRLNGRVSDVFVAIGQELIDSKVWAPFVRGMETLLGEERFQLLARHARVVADEWQTAPGPETGPTLLRLTVREESFDHSVRMYTLYGDALPMTTLSFNHSISHLISDEPYGRPEIYSATVDAFRASCLARRIDETIPEFFSILEKSPGAREDLAAGARHITASLVRVEAELRLRGDDSHGAQLDAWWMKIDAVLDTLSRAP